ncbi:hypothetical protein [Hellea balneolensis]|uniref:hypothetical protein n=1 Tax=Hellea balneolensis TaxID=287478 RepID=UPI0004239408|nr:hypothetical protein [Hellea balneolensis]
MSFNETQKFSSKILWFMRVSLVLTLLVLLSAFFLAGDANNGLILSLIALICVPVFLILEFCQLKTKIDAKGIDLNFRPFTRKYYAWADVQDAKLINYGFVGGWGIRMTLKYGTVYNTQGQEGVLLTMKTGKKIVIGTQRKTAMQAALNKFFKA